MQKLKVNAGKFLGANQQVRLQKAQQLNKEEAFQDGDFTQKAHQYLSSSAVLENTCSPHKNTYLLKKVFYIMPLKQCRLMSLKGNRSEKFSHGFNHMQTRKSNINI